ncbi:MAG: hypothetical protein ABIK28_00885, partial [Planctomycetota bacterium]
MGRRALFCITLILFIVVGAIASGGEIPDYSEAFIPEDDMFQKTFFVLVNGSSNYSGPMIREFLGAEGEENETVFGNGQYAKVGLM